MGGGNASLLRPSPQVCFSFAVLKVFELRPSWKSLISAWNQREKQHVRTIAYCWDPDFLVDTSAQLTTRQRIIIEIITSIQLRIAPYHSTPLQPPHQNPPKSPRTPRPPRSSDEKGEKSSKRDGTHRDQTPPARDGGSKEEWSVINT